MRGCTPRVESGHKRTVTAQVEIAEGMVVSFFAPVIVPVPAVEGVPAILASIDHTTEI